MDIDLFSEVNDVKDNSYEFGMNIVLSESVTEGAIDYLNIDATKHEESPISFVDPELGGANRALLRQYIDEAMQSYVEDVIVRFNETHIGVNMSFIAGNPKAGDGRGFYLCLFTFENSVDFDAGVELRRVKEIAKEVSDRNDYAVEGVVLAVDLDSENKTTDVFKCRVRFSVESVESKEYAV